MAVGSLKSEFPAQGWSAAQSLRWRRSTLGQDLAATDETGVDRVELRVDNVLVGVAVPVNGTVTFTYDTRVVVDGNHQFRANAVDVLGLRGTSGTRFLRVDNTAPVSDATAPYSATWDPKGATYGTHVLTAVASDTAGNTATSAVTVWGK